MCFYIGIEDLAANALIELLRLNNERFVSYKELENYGAEVVEILLGKGEKAVLVLSRDSTDAMFRNYSNYFEETNRKCELGIALKDNISIEDLVQVFRGSLALEVLLAFMNQKSISKLDASA